MSNTSFQELNLSNSFLFLAALEDPITCKLVLECIIDEQIGELAVRAEYTKQYNLEFKCIRLDVYAKDTLTELSYNLESSNDRVSSSLSKKMFSDSPVDYSRGILCTGNMVKIGDFGKEMG